MAADREVDGFLAMDEFAMDARSLDPETFERRHGPAFLVRSLETLDEGMSDREDRDTAVLGVPIMPDLSTLFAVYPVRSRSGRTSGPILVGRSTEADISIGDVSIDTRHAELIATPDGFVVVDKGSSHGTSIDGNPLQPDSPHPIPPGKTIQFGNVRMTFLPTQWFIEFVVANVTDSA